VLSGKSILLLTYNASLKKETREKSKNIENLEVHSFHSFGKKYYSDTCIDDQAILLILKRKMTHKTSFEFDLVIIDECQDMNKIYF